MKTTISKTFTTLVLLAFVLVSGNSFAQSKVDIDIMKDCCMMKDGKMVQYTGGKSTPMKKTVVMANGTKVKKNGKVIMPDGTKMKMKNGNCVDNSGKMDNCAVKDGYVCPMHSDVVSGKSGKCPKCGMELTKKG